MRHILQPKIILDQQDNDILVYWYGVASKSHRVIGG